MGRRIIVDTNVAIGIERDDPEALRLVHDDDDVVIAAVTRAELLVGPLLSPSARRSAGTRDLVKEMESLDYTNRTADEHALLLAHTRRTGQPRGAHDLIIAAHAAETGRLVCSLDVKARFGDLPGVRIASE